MARTAMALAALALAVAVLALLRTLPSRPPQLTDSGGAPIEATAAGPAATSPGVAMRRLSDHLAAAWYAAKATNPALVEYELTEMGEAAGEVEGRVRKGRVMNPEKRITPAIGSLRRANESGDWEAFDRAYHQALDACNSCHREHAVPIEVTVPDQPPVSNRRWGS